MDSQTPNISQLISVKLTELRQTNSNASERDAIDALVKVYAEELTKHNQEMEFQANLIKLEPESKQNELRKEKIRILSERFNDVCLVLKGIKERKEV